ncbi:DUF1292 domain-containing protein [Serpentinicella sp. ANB-PHB4]|uniref:DUF1292 domain-containing protein n=1 Tax=Serpentinicella sp. ANB-PHB4 TaxID=3074076 RepID=UPI002866E0FC|nr:DUF1292 domain-containing protein [Serpentinicella sp. ANB-PHB4]MDR5659047.1 DUF1292 domain-containing protein [Serpentinicella sp. ANB-PHB4]
MENHPNHDHECDENCNHDHHHNKIYITLMDNSQLECDVIDIFKVKDKEYIAILPKDSETALIYAYSETEAGPELANIENDEEYAAVSTIFMENNSHHQE